MEHYNTKAIFQNSGELHRKTLVSGSFWAKTSGFLAPSDKAQPPESNELYGCCREDHRCQDRGWEARVIMHGRAVPLCSGTWPQHRAVREAGRPTHEVEVTVGFATHASSEIWATYPGRHETPWHRDGIFQKRHRIWLWHIPERTESASSEGWSQTVSDQKVPICHAANYM